MYIEISYIPELPPNDAPLVLGEKNIKSCCMDLIGASCVICLRQQQWPLQFTFYQKDSFASVEKESTAP